MFRYLVARGADPHATNAYGCNAAMWAAQGPGTTVHVFNELRALHLNMDAINNNGQGCLHKAAQRGNKAICVWLLEVAKVCRKPFRSSGCARVCRFDLTFSPSQRIAALRLICCILQLKAAHEKHKPFWTNCHISIMIYTRRFDTKAILNPI